MPETRAELSERGRAAECLGFATLAKGAADGGAVIDQALRLSNRVTAPEIQDADDVKSQRVGFCGRQCVSVAVARRLVAERQRDERQAVPDNYPTRGQFVDRTRHGSSS